MWANVEVCFVNLVEKEAKRTVLSERLGNVVWELRVSLFQFDVNCENVTAGFFMSASNSLGLDLKIFTISWYSCFDFFPFDTAPVLRGFLYYIERNYNGWNPYQYYYIFGHSHLVFNRLLEPLSSVLWYHLLLIVVSLQKIIGPDCYSIRLNYHLTNVQVVRVVVQTQIF